jgi:hypothetical protein
MKGDIRENSTNVIMPQKMDDVECVYCRKRYTKEYLYSIEEIVDDLISIEVKLRYTRYIIEEQELNNRSILLSNTLQENVERSKSPTIFSSGLIRINEKPIDYEELVLKVKMFEAGLAKVSYVTEEIVINNRIFKLCKELIETYAFVNYSTIVDEYYEIYSDIDITENKVRDILRHKDNNRISFNNKRIYNKNPSKTQIKNTAEMYEDYSFNEIKNICRGVYGSSGM